MLIEHAEIRFTYHPKREDTEKYKAKYIGFSTPPINIRLGLGGTTEYGSKNYSDFIRGLINDLRSSKVKGAELKFSGKFDDNIRFSITSICRLVFDRNTLEEKIARAKVALI